MKTYNANCVHTLKELICLNDFVEPHGPRLLHALETEPEIHRKLKFKFFVSLDDVEPTKRRALGVTGSAAKKPPIFLRQNKRFSVPPVLLSGLSSDNAVLNGLRCQRTSYEREGETTYRLNVVVAVT